MQLSYGGAITKKSEVEKVIINTSFITNTSLIKEAVKIAGSQSIVISLVVKNEFLVEDYVIQMMN